MDTRTSYSGMRLEHPFIAGARILGAVASSHTRTIGFALGTHKQDDPVWAPIFAGYNPVQEWLAAKRPDVLLMI
jgi:gallate dioxygenase